MSLVLAFNPGSNSLKFDLIDIRKSQRYASGGQKLISGNVDDVGRAGRDGIEPFTGDL